MHSLVRPPPAPLPHTKPLMPTWHETRRLLAICLAMDPNSSTQDSDGVRAAWSHSPMLIKCTGVGRLWDMGRDLATPWQPSSIHGSSNSKSSSSKRSRGKGRSMGKFVGTGTGVGHLGSGPVQGCKGSGWLQGDTGWALRGRGRTRQAAAQVQPCVPDRRHPLSQVLLRTSSHPQACS